MKQLKGKYIMVLVAMCGMIGASLGLLTNVSGLFFTPIAEEWGIGRGSVSLSLTISNLVFAVGGIMAARWYHSTNFKRLVRLAAIVFAGTSALLALAPNLVILYLLNAIRGFAGGLCGNVIVTMVINNWFHSNTGLITSIAMGCSGISGAVFSPIISSIIEKTGWRIGYLVDGVLILIFYLPVMLLPIALRPEDVDWEPMGERSDAVPKAHVAAAEASKKPAVFLLVMAFAFSIVCAFVASFPPHMPGIAGSFGLSAAVGSAMLSACLVANTVGKILFGALADRIGAKRTILIYSIVIAAGIILLMLHPASLMIPTAFLFGMVYSLPTMGVILLVREVFGTAEYTRIYPKVNLATTIANAVGTSIVGFLYDLSGNYMLALICALVGIGITLITALAAYSGKVR